MVDGFDADGLSARIGQPVAPLLLGIYEHYEQHAYAIEQLNYHTILGVARAEYGHVPRPGYHSSQNIPTTTSRRQQHIPQAGLP